MGLGGIVRGIVPVIKDIIGGQDGLMDDVTIRYWQRDLDDAGTGDYSDPVAFQAVVIRIQKLVVTSSGQEAMSTSQIIFVEELPAHGEAGRREPLDERDIITLSDGTTGPILTVGPGLMDQGTHAPYLLEVFLG